MNSIERGDPVNVTGLRRVLPLYVRESLNSYFEITPVDAKLSRVIPQYPTLLSELSAWATVPTSRIEATIKGDSHQFVVSKAYLMAFTESASSVYPDTIVISGEAAFHGFAPKRIVLLIENEENFFAWREMLSFANTCLGRDDLSTNTVDVILAGGNRINKAVTLKWLNATYAEVLCAFDYDLGGLKMFETLKNTISRADFLMPESWEHYCSAFCKTPGTTGRLRKASEKAEALKFFKLSKMFETTRHFMEQEMLLTEDFKNGF